MINASNIYVQYGDRILLNKVNLVVANRDKLGLVGRNGAGKSTLLKIISGNNAPQEGNVSRPKESTLGFLHQDMDVPKGKSVMEETLSAFEEVRAIELQIEQINVEIGARTDYESEAYSNLIVKMTTLRERFDILGGHSMHQDAEYEFMGWGSCLAHHYRHNTDDSRGR